MLGTRCCDRFGAAGTTSTSARSSSTWTASLQLMRRGGATSFALRTTVTRTRTASPGSPFQRATTASESSQRPTSKRELSFCSTIATGSSKRTCTWGSKPKKRPEAAADADEAARTAAPQTPRPLRSCRFPINWRGNQRLRSYLGPRCKYCNTRK